MKKNLKQDLLHIIESCTWLQILIIIVIVAFISAIIIFVYMKKETARKNNIKPTENKNINYFDKYISEDFYAGIKSGDFNRNIYPRFSDREAWAKARKNRHADMIIANADAVLGKDIPQFRFSEFRRFAIDGNRDGYEKIYYERRRNLNFSVLALCLTGDKAKYMPTVLDYVVAIMEEFTWTFPAHSYWQEKRLSDVDNTDLFCAETGAMMAIIYHILGDELDKEIENISEKIRIQTLQRTLYNIFYTPHIKVHRRHWWFDLFWRKNNWTPWCSANCILTAILLEKDNEKLAYFIHRLLQSNAIFVSQYSEDGFCEEGCDYYYASGLRLCEIFYMLHRIKPGSMEKVIAVPKLRAILEFIAHCNINDKYRINFADGSAFATQKISASLAACAKLIDSRILQDFVGNKQASLGGLGNELSTCMKILFDMPEQKEVKETELIPFTYFKDRIAILRSNDFSATIKAGHNAESHNHNDLGHFTVFYKGEPVIVDAGTEVYSRINFSEERYTLWYTRGSGHNAPVFDNIEQQNDSKYKAVFDSANKNKIICNLSKAYPVEAGVKKFLRTLDFSADSVVITDNFELEKAKDANIKLLALRDVEKLANGDIKIGDVIMKLNGIEFIKTEKLPKMNGGWKCVVNEIYLKSSKNNYSISFSQK